MRTSAQPLLADLHFAKYLLRKTSEIYRYIEMRVPASGTG
jgi:hypothetical protein